MPPWAIGRRIVVRMRQEASSEERHCRGEEGEDVLRSLYLMERFGCVPEHPLGDDILATSGRQQSGQGRLDFLRHLSDVCALTETQADSGPAGRKESRWKPRTAYAAAGPARSRP